MNQEISKESSGDDASYEEGNPNEGKEEGIDVPEEFQAKAHALVKGASRAHLSHLSSKISARQEELSKEESKKRSTGKIKTFSVDDMPKD
jgi:hypothetical protein